MDFETKYKDQFIRPFDMSEDREYSIQKVSVLGNCWRCETLTRWFGIEYCEYFCSEECMDSYKEKHSKGAERAHKR